MILFPLLAQVKADLGAQLRLGLCRFGSSGCEAFESKTETRSLFGFPNQAAFGGVLLEAPRTKVRVTQFEIRKLELLVGIVIAQAEGELGQQHSFYPEGEASLPHSRDQGLVAADQEGAGGGAADGAVEAGEKGSIALVQQEALRCEGPVVSQWVFEEEDRAALALGSPPQAEGFGCERRAVEPCEGTFFDMADLLVTPRETQVESGLAPEAFGSPTEPGIGTPEGGSGAAHFAFGDQGVDRGGAGIIEIFSATPILITEFEVEKGGCTTPGFGDAPAILEAEQLHRDPLHRDKGAQVGIADPRADGAPARAVSFEADVELSPLLLDELVFLVKPFAVIAMKIPCRVKDLLSLSDPPLEKSFVGEPAPGLGRGEELSLVEVAEFAFEEPPLGLMAEFGFEAGEPKAAIETKILVEAPFGTIDVHKPETQAEAPAEGPRGVFAEGEFLAGLLEVVLQLIALLDVPGLLSAGVAELCIVPEELKAFLGAEAVTASAGGKLGGGFVGTLLVGPAVRVAGEAALVFEGWWAIAQALGEGLGVEAAGKGLGFARVAKVAGEALAGDLPREARSQQQKNSESEQSQRRQSMQAERGRESGEGAGS